MSNSRIQRPAERVIKTAAAGGILQDEKILLVYSKSLDTWQIPGGIQEIGETIQETVEREIREELGLDFVAETLVSVYSGTQWNVDYPDGGKIQQVLFFFLMNGKIGGLSPKPKRFLSTPPCNHRFSEFCSCPISAVLR